MFVYVGVHFISLAHLFHCKKFEELDIKLFNVNINFKKLMVNFVCRFFHFGVASTALSPSLYIYIYTHPIYI